MNPKDKFQEALRLYDNKDYKESRRTCDKILEKQPSNEEALALKGLTLLNMKEKEEGEKLIKDALIHNFKNATVWHFYAIFNKEIKNYKQAVSCYSRAHKCDPNNFTILRDLSYLELFLGRYSSFCEYSRKAVDLKPNLIVNWITLSFGLFLTKRYSNALSIIDLAFDKRNDFNNKQYIHEVLIYKADILMNLEKYDEALKLLCDNIDKCIDRVLYFEKIVNSAIKSKKYDTAKEYCKKLLEINNENINYFIWHFNLHLSLYDQGKEIKSYNDLLNLGEDSQLTNDCYKLLNEYNSAHAKKKKSKLILRLELALSRKDDFRKLFLEYFTTQVKITIPSFYINVKFIYESQQYKIPTISEILTAHIKSIESNNLLDTSLTNGEKLGENPNIIWVYFYAAQHYDNLANSELALKYINLAIDNTPSVVEFYMVKSRILKHCLLFEESAQSYLKAKRLDLGDRYLNAKYAKIYARIGDVKESVKIMTNFVVNPLDEPSIVQFQVMWYQTEIAYAFIKSHQYINAHRILKGTLGNFIDINEDQGEFYNYCLRRYMLTEFYSTIEFMKRLYNNQYLFATLNSLDLIRDAIQDIKDEDLLSEFNEMKKNYEFEKYTFENKTKLVKQIEDDMYYFLVRVQMITKEPTVHYLCVKYFLLKKKILFALKSVKYLINNWKENYYTSQSIVLFQNYEKENSASFNDTIKEVIKENIPSELKVEFKCEDETEEVILKLKEKKMFDKTNEKVAEEFVKKITSEKLRKIPNRELNILFVYISLYCGKDYLKTFLNELKEKAKLNNVTKDDLTGNTVFWESKEDYKIVIDKYHKNK